MPYQLQTYTVTVSTGSVYTLRMQIGLNSVSDGFYSIGVLARSSDQYVWGGFKAGEDTYREDYNEDYNAHWILNVATAIDMAMIHGIKSYIKGGGFAGMSMGDYLLGLGIVSTCVDNGCVTEEDAHDGET